MVLNDDANLNAYHPRRRQQPQPQHQDPTGAAPPLNQPQPLPPPSTITCVDDEFDDVATSYGAAGAALITQRPPRFMLPVVTTTSTTAAVIATTTTTTTTTALQMRSSMIAAAGGDDDGGRTSSTSTCSWDRVSTSPITTEAGCGWVRSPTGTTATTPFGDDVMTKPLRTGADDTPARPQLLAQQLRQVASKPPVTRRLARHELDQQHQADQVAIDQLAAVTATDVALAVHEGMSQRAIEACVATRDAVAFRAAWKRDAETNRHQLDQLLAKQQEEDNAVRQRLQAHAAAARCATVA